VPRAKASSDEVEQNVVRLRRRARLLRAQALAELRVSRRLAGTALSARRNKAAYLLGLAAEAEQLAERLEITGRVPKPRTGDT
jgi:hypothetical protein